VADHAQLRLLLLEDRATTRQRIEALTHDFDTIVQATAGVATDDEHDPEGATIAFERAATAALLDQARTHLTDIDEALARIDSSGYGVCESCGKPIAPARLEARPVARTCITCATKQVKT
jgi:RNA polymerase-binding protein DksA